MFIRSKPSLQVLKHIQDTPATTWTITHNFGVHPSVDVMLDINGGYQKAMPLSIAHSDENTTVVSWSQNRTGLVALSSE